VPATLTARLDNAIGNIEKLGYHCLKTPSVRSNAKCVSVDAETRAKEFMSLYENSDVKAIIPPWGGEFLMGMLPYLDYDYLTSLPAKWVCGYSDITTLTFVLPLLCDMAAIHGSNFMNMGFKVIHESDLLVKCKFQRLSQSFNDLPEKCTPPL
jgi:muramoyltetrapeptide carboxypeptidase LdcA involved in peptidoglycan recycling